jgi:hypothetical protein
MNNLIVTIISSTAAVITAGVFAYRGLATRISSAADALVRASSLAASASNRAASTMAESAQTITQAAASVAASIPTGASIHAVKRADMDGKKLLDHSHTVEFTK